MRFDRPVYFQKITPGEYDPETGDYKPDTVTETKKRASVTDSGLETMKIIYGDIKQGSLTIRLQSHYNSVFDFIRVGGKIYHADIERKLRKNHVFVVSEVQKNVTS